MTTGKLTAGSSILVSFPWWDSRPGLQRERDDERVPESWGAVLDLGARVTCKNYPGADQRSLGCSSCSLLPPSLSRTLISTSVHSTWPLPPLPLPLRLIFPGCCPYLAWGPVGGGCRQKTDIHIFRQVWQVPLARCLGEHEGRQPGWSVKGARAETGGLGCFRRLVWGQRVRGQQGPLLPVILQGVLSYRSPS